MRSSRPRSLRRARGAALAAAVAIGLGGGVVACTGDDAAPPGTTEVDEATAVQGFRAYPEDWPWPIEAAVGERFSLVLGAEPSEGYRWEVVQAPDPVVVLALGSRFLGRDSDALVTSTLPLPPPPPPTEPPPPPEGAPSTTTSSTTTTTVDDSTTTTEPPTTTTTEPTAMVQVLSYAARGPGTTTITLRYARVGAPPSEQDRTVTFTIDVPEPPPLFGPAPGEEPPPEGEAGEGAAGA